MWERGEFPTYDTFDQNIQNNDNKKNLKKNAFTLHRDEINDSLFISVVGCDRWPTGYTLCSIYVSHISKDSSILNIAFLFYLARVKPF